MINSHELYITTTSGQLFVKCWQPETESQQAPLVLLHDSLGCVGMWRDFPMQLCQLLQRPIIAYDRLGFGHSEPQTSPPSLSFIKDEVTVFLALKEQLAFDDYWLLGHSVGGAMAISIAARDKCLGVISISAQAYVEERTLEGIREAITFFSDPAQFSRITRWHGERSQWVFDSWTKTWLSKEYANWNLLPTLTQVNCPLLAIHGQEDEYGSCDSPKAIVEHSSGYAELLLLEDCAHMPHREQTSSVLSAIDTFICGCESR